ncbi:MULTISPECIES: sulfite oxidase heme-binding subunit YedZ [unclassified Thioalkalivibrio]|uniref:sulfite oxidase heme-binding subunit YedZ n=1 Tax=unclassified Thioalkalivibrio TaxID=2621013 RepID=UPI000399C6AC|nr:MULTISPECIES: protein-methionine-sulfoxide reductase heme-binding subunit MsrQ [unclassified Thioalkalivibrio]
MATTQRRKGQPPKGVWTGVLLLSLVPAVWIGLRTLGWFGGLGANPIEKLLELSGTHAMIALLIALAVTPLRQMTGFAWITRLRRMLGLVAFGYVTAHALTWLGLDLFFDWELVLYDLTERPFVMVGFAAWVILLALAVTSTDGAQRWLRKKWVWLHRGVYVAGVLAILHFLWLARADYGEVTLYAAILAFLLGWRVVHSWISARRVRARRAATAS